MWSNPARAEEQLKQRNDLDQRITYLRTLDELEADIDAALADSELGEFLEELQSTYRAHVQLGVSRYLDTSANTVYLTVSSGAGGTESQDFAGILFRMYTRYCERHFNTQLTDFNPGGKVGIRDATLEVTGDAVYSVLQTESGIHRLSRVSPYDSRKRRHTSFASVQVVPLIEKTDVTVSSDDLKVETCRGHGAGGQHRNVTDSAVRIVHLPTNTVVTCQSERSQHKNRATAMKMLLSILHQKRDEAHRDEIDAARHHNAAAFANQIRSYVLNPYQLIIDHARDVKINAVDRVLNGELELLYAR